MTLKKLIYILITSLILLLGGWGVYFYVEKQELPYNSSSNLLNKILPSPTPFPFQEMTIPYLRQRVFSSQLSDISKVSETGNYTQYTASYNSEGLKINGLLTQPKGQQPEGGWPAIVFVHGYIPPTNYETLGSAYSSYVDYLAKNDFVVFKIDLRGHGDSEGEAGGGYYSSDYVLDTLNAYSALQNSDFVNKDKIGLWGHSMAGNVTLRTFAVKTEIPAVVVWAGAGFTYEDLQTYRINDTSYRPPPENSERQKKRDELFSMYGSFTKDSDFWKKVTPGNYLDSLNGAIQLHHAVDDNVVNVEYSRNLNSLLDKTKVVHELHEYSSGGHDISGSSFTSAMQKTVDFYNKYF